MNGLSRMKILHVTPHLGGGVGRCLSAISAVRSDKISREFLLLESPIDKSFYDIVSQKCKIQIVNYQSDLENYLKSFDIIQCEFWNHPAMLHFLNYSKNLKLRRIFWCHISGRGAIRLPLNFLQSDNKIIFTSEVSNAEYGTENAIVNSGFIFPKSKQCSMNISRKYDFVYAGQLDYRKLHSKFANIITHAARISDSELNILGDGKDKKIIQNEILSRNVVFHGHITNVEDYFRQSKFLIYPLDEEHYGTGENIIKEAMSLGCIPLLLSNPAELEIMKEYSNLSCYKTVEDLAQSLSAFIENDKLVTRYSHLLKEFSEKNYAPELSANLLTEIYCNTLNSQEFKAFDMEDTFGGSPTEWYESFSSSEAEELDENRDAPNKGSRIHFEHHFSQGEEILGVNYEQ